jgi:hypothetical protein
MSRVVAVVEGQTEQTFVRDILAPILAQQGVMLTARLVGKPGRKGGVGSYSRARRDILAVLRQDTAVFCTTMFDFYEMPHDWPQRITAHQAPFADKAALIEDALLQDISEGMGTGFQQSRFIPYVQMHEFEALLFSDSEQLAQIMQQREKTIELKKIEAQFNFSPETINDNVETAPSKRIQNHFPAYNKVLHGTLAAQRIDFSTMRRKCLHFSSWLARLEALGADEPA